MSTETQTPKVLVTGAGWAGLGATHHLAKQGYDVTLVKAGPYPGGLVAGWKTPGGRSVEVGIHCFVSAIYTITYFLLSRTYSAFQSAQATG
ncbi:MAG: NAD(P)-binding protein [Microcoleaceae cyanobacterium]